MKECLDLQLVHPSTQAASESPLAPKVEIANSPFQKLQKFDANLY